MSSKLESPLNMHSPFLTDKVTVEDDWQFDREYNDSVITRVTNGHSNEWYIGLDCGSFSLPATTPITPVCGMTLRMWGKGFGYPIRGAALIAENTVVPVYYRTKRTEDVLNTRQRQLLDAENVINATRVYDEVQQRKTQLPAVFQQRFARFNAGSERFWYRFEEYELVACEAAVAIATMWATPAGVESFKQMDHDAQMAVMPELDKQGLSGNMWDFALYMAKLYLEKPELVAIVHGAMVPLVGCKDYGCTHEG